MSLREKQKTQVRDLIFQTALKLYREQGVSGTTIDQITQEAGVAKGTFFNHFPTKGDMISEFIKIETDRIAEETLSLGPRTGKESMLAFARRLGEFGEKNRELVQHLSLLRDRHPRFIDGEIEENAGLMGKVAAVIGQGVNSKSAGYSKVETLAGTIIAMVTGTVHEWHLSEASFKLPHVLVERMGLMNRLI